MELLQWFEKGLTAEQYIGRMQTHKENLEKVYASFQLSDVQKKELSTVSTEGMKVIVIAEDWCGDAMVNIPVLLRITEEASIDVRFILRDSHLELMDQYLTNGTARSIPIFIFIDEAGNEQAVWGPRAARVQEMFEEVKAQFPAEDDPAFKEKQTALITEFMKLYTDEPSTWAIIADSIIEKLKLANA